MKEQTTNWDGLAEKVNDIYSRAISDAVDRELASMAYSRLKEAQKSQPKFV